jgi:hypothetical protein
MDLAVPEHPEPKVGLLLVLNQKLRRRRHPPRNCRELLDDRVKVSVVESAPEDRAFWMLPASPTVGIG